MGNPSTQTQMNSIPAPDSHQAVVEMPSKSSPDEALQHPPRAPLVLRVGVVGHRPDPKKRPNPDVAALRETCRELLLHIQDTFGGVATSHRDLFAEPPARVEGNVEGSPPCGLRLVSALAEGADQWVAGEAQQLGYELQVVLPFERQEYEKDFDENARREHCRLRALASAVFELDGCRAHANASYLAAGLVVLNQSDLLIALWDGKDPQGVGGTGQIVQEALRRGIPIVWVNWASPSEWHIKRPAWRMLRQPVDLQGDLRLLTDEVIQLLLPPQADGDEPHGRDLREAYFCERRRSWTPLGGWWAFLRDLVCGKMKLPRMRVPNFISATREDWRKDWEGRGEEDRHHKLPPAITRWIEKSYLASYAWANGLSVYYANNYRSSFLWIYLLGALAVFLALIAKTAIAKTVQAPPGEASGGSSLAEPLCIAAEVIAIAAIIFLTWYGRRRCWHERWIDYRTLAEQLRVAAFNSMLGGMWHQVRVPSHLATYGNPAATWMHWHARAVQRAAGLPNMVVSTEYLSGFKELLLQALIGGQENYHVENTKRLGPVDHRLRFFGEVLFLATFAACVTHFYVARSDIPDSWDRWLTFCAAFLPALGAAVAAIRSQGEFHRVVRRSRGMGEELQQLREAVANLPVRSNELNSRLLQQAAEQTTRLMYNEVLDWRIVFQERPLVWPA